MVVDPINLSGTIITEKQEQKAVVEITREANLADKGIPEAGRTSDVGPAVVNNISVAALETSRAINAPDQTADKEGLSDYVSDKTKGCS